MTLGAKEIESVCELCAAEGYPYNEETCMGCEDNPHKRSDDMGCYYVGEPLHEDGTTTFEPVTQGVNKYFKCNYCGCIVGTPYNFSVGIDYNFCPYCGRPVVESEDDTNE